MSRIDHVAKGKGLALAQAKVTRANGSVEYYISRPQIKWYDLVGWLWYFAHKRDLVRSRA